MSSRCKNNAGYSVLLCRLFAAAERLPALKAVLIGMHFERWVRRKNGSKDWISRGEYAICKSK